MPIILRITEATVLKPILHGGDLGEATRRFPNAPKPWLDLSTGINPLPYPVSAPAAEAWSRLPSREAEEALQEAAMTRYRVPRRSMIVAAPGTQALIQILPRLLPPSRVAIVGPTYEEHQSSWNRAGHEIHIVPTIEDSDVVVVVNPNNPSGRLFSHQELAKIAGFLVVDEAFIDFLPREMSAAGRLPGRVVVLRSFGKTYGLAGLRLGVAIARPDIATRIREELGPWAVSGPALEIGRRALADDAWLSAARERLLADGARLDELLRTAGFASVGATPLFRLARHDDVPAVVERLGRQGIHVRAFSRQPQWLRFGLPGTDEAFRRLAGAL